MILLEAIKSCGVYELRCVPTGDAYIGATNGIGRRASQHVDALQAGNHDNDRLQQLWNEHGADKFTLTMLETCDEAELYDRERALIAERLPTLNRNGGGGRKRTPKPETVTIEIPYELFKSLEWISEERHRTVGQQAAYWLDRCVQRVLNKPQKD